MEEICTAVEMTARAGAGAMDHVGRFHLGKDTMEGAVDKGERGTAFRFRELLFSVHDCRSTSAKTFPLFPS